MGRKVNPYGAELKIARRQRRRLQAMVEKLTDMAIEWDGLSGGLECDFNLLAESLLPQLDVLDMQIRDWSEGVGDREESGW
ncbi:hypothetical protein [Pantoea sp. BAV 3049]|uniref:hypothetical protein n=1 Tax=Pantoea sp. BAV 3049 TaxID=2654188 RepID=UPI00131CA6D8|nr:hypothetical protein [Pantoea sp. BAV 3049]